MFIIFILCAIVLCLYCFSPKSLTFSGTANDERVVKSFSKNKFYYQNRPEKYEAKVPIFANLDFTKFTTLEPGTVVCCKTKQAYSLLKKHYPSLHLVYTGFSSIDRFLPSQKTPNRYRKFLHVFGNSPYKGTPKIVKIWKKHPEWPELVMFGNDKWNAVTNIGDYSAKNIKLSTEILSEKKLAEIMNNFGIHLCMSVAEGFGHYLNEARSAKAVIVYTDAPPMNEFVDNSTGFGVSSFLFDKTNRICPFYGFSEKDFVKTINTIISTDISVLQKMGELSRKRFLLDDNNFKRTVTKIFPNK